MLLSILKIKETIHHILETALNDDYSDFLAKKDLKILSNFIVCTLNNYINKNNLTEKIDLTILDLLEIKDSIRMIYKDHLFNLSDKKKEILEALFYDELSIAIMNMISGLKRLKKEKTKLSFIISKNFDCKGK